MNACRNFLGKCDNKRIVQIAVVPHNGDLTVIGPALFLDLETPIALTVKNVGGDAVSVGVREPLGWVPLAGAADIEESARL